MDDAGPSSYGRVFTGRHPDEQPRLEAFASVFDVFTRDRLGGLPVAGGTVLEVGPGCGSIAEWMQETWKPEELVLLDRDADLLRRVAPLASRTVHADITQPGPAPGRFDRIHARLVLMHLPDPEAALRTRVSWLRPGGWLVLGDSVDTSPVTADARVRELMRLARNAVETVVGSSFDWAASFPEPLRRAGLTDLGVALDVPTMSTADAIGTALRLSLRGLLDAAGDHDLADRDAAEALFNVLDEPGLATVAPVGLVTTWGRRS